MSRWNRMKTTLAQAVELNTTAPAMAWEASFDADGLDVSDRLAQNDDAPQSASPQSAPRRGVRLQAGGLTKRYGQREVLHDLDQSRRRMEDLLHPPQQRHRGNRRRSGLGNRRRSRTRCYRSCGSTHRLGRR